MVRLESRTVDKEPFFVTQSHHHPYWEILVMLEGKGGVNIEGEKPQMFCAGDVIMVPENTRHSLEYAAATKIICIYGPLQPGDQRGHKY